MAVHNRASAATVTVVRRRTNLAAGALAGVLLTAACWGGGEPPDPVAAASAAPEPRTTSGSVGAGRGPGVRSACRLPLQHVRRIQRGYYPARSPDIMFVPRKPNFVGSFPLWTTHSGPWGYVQEVPLMLHGPGFIERRGEIALDREVTVADIAPTIAELLGMSFPPGRDGKAVAEALTTPRGRPRLVVTVVWDGGGRNVLDAWPRAWPNLARLMARGTSVARATVGSSPSVTPAVHSTIGTGAFPSRHGISDIPLREGDGIANSFEDRTPRHLELRTVADLYDRSTGNRAKVGMVAQHNTHLGMLGQGAYSPGGDKDVAVMVERPTGELVTNRKWYSLPAHLRSVPGFDSDVRALDTSDGELDSTWLGHTELGDRAPAWDSPAGALYQTRLIEAVIDKEGFGRDEVTDLLFVNYKQIDLVGHQWNMLAGESREVIRFTDDALGRLTRILDRMVGRRQWVLVLTADHGQAPDPLEVGAWPINMQVLRTRIAQRFDVDRDDLFDDQRPTGFWLDRETMERADIRADEIVAFLLDYRLRDSIEEGDDVPERYRSRLDERLFAAAFESEKLPAIWRCAQRRAEP